MSIIETTNQIIMKVSIVSENCAKYTDNDSGNSFTLTHHKIQPQENNHDITSCYQKCPDHDTWIYRPCNDTPQMISNKTTLAHIKSIATKLPKISLPMIMDNRDYPILKSEALPLVGVDYHMNREVFVIGGHAFFRRYNDDWNGVVMYGCSSLGSNVSWDKNVNSIFLQKLDVLLNKVNPECITFDDIDLMLKSQ